MQQKRQEQCIHWVGTLATQGLQLFEGHHDSKGFNLGESSQVRESVTRRRDHSGLKRQTQPSSNPPGFWRSNLGTNYTSEALC